MLGVKRWPTLANSAAKDSNGVQRSWSFWGGQRYQRSRSCGLGLKTYCFTGCVLSGAFRDSFPTECAKCTCYSLKWSSSFFLFVCFVCEYSKSLEMRRYLTGQNSRALLTCLSTSKLIEVLLRGARLKKKPGEAEMCPIPPPFYLPRLGVAWQCNSQSQRAGYRWWSSCEFCGSVLDANSLERFCLLCKISDGRTLCCTPILQFRFHYRSVIYYY